MDFYEYPRKEEHYRSIKVREYEWMRRKYVLNEI